MISSKKIVKWIALVVGLLLLFNIVYSTYLILVAFKVKNNNIDSSKKDINIDVKNMASIEIMLNNTSVILKEGSEFKIDTNNSALIASNEDGKVLVIENQNKIDFTNKKYTAIITIPKEFKNVNIKNVSGITKIQDLHLENLNVEIATGEILVEDVKVDKISNFNASVGKGIFNNSTFNNFKLKIGVGEIRVNSQLRGNCEVKSNVGNTKIILLDGLENYSILSKKGIGIFKIRDKEVKNNTTTGNGTNKLLVKNNIGNISIL